MRKGFDNCEPSSGLPPRGSSRIGGLAVQAAITARVPRLAMQRITGRLKPAIKAASSRRCRVEKLMDIVTTLLFRDVCDQDRKSTRLNSSHVAISYAVFCLKKKTEE